KSRGKMKNSSDNITIPETGKIAFRFYDTNGGKRSFLDKGHNTNYITIAILMIPLIALIIAMINYEQVLNDRFAIIALALFCTIFPSYVLWTYYNMAPEIAIDDNFLYVRKLKTFKRIPFADVNYILYSPSITGASSIKIIKKKGAKRLSFTYFIIRSSTLKDKELLSTFFAELEKKVRLEHNKWNRIFKKKRS
ncbi:MAG: hypothetical protein JSU85_00445, partial [Candidatus Zixiibacteriota bacterium]